MKSQIVSRIFQPWDERVMKGISHAGYSPNMHINRNAWQLVQTWTVFSVTNSFTNRPAVFRIQKSNKIKIVFRSSAKQLVVHIPHIHAKHGIFALCLAQLHSLTRKWILSVKGDRAGVFILRDFWVLARIRKLCCNSVGDWPAIRLLKRTYSLTACKRCFRSGVVSSAGFCLRWAFSVGLFSVAANCGPCSCPLRRLSAARWRSRPWAIKFGVFACLIVASSPGLLSSLLE